MLVLEEARATAQKDACELRASLREEAQAGADARRELQDLRRKVRAPPPQRCASLLQSGSPRRPRGTLWTAEPELRDIASLAVPLERSVPTLAAPAGGPAQTRGAPGWICPMGYRRQASKLMAKNNHFDARGL